jgi:hypothetical protein
MDMRKTPKDIEEGILSGFSEEGWQDLVEEFAYDSDREENHRLLALCARFLHTQAPDELFGWQDFDILISEKFGGRWSSVLTYAAQVVGEEAADIGDSEEQKAFQKHFDSMSDERFVKAFLSRPGVHVLEAGDQPGGVVVFSGLRDISAIRRI